MTIKTHLAHPRWIAETQTRGLWPTRGSAVKKFLHNKKKTS